VSVDNDLRQRSKQQQETILGKSRFSRFSASIAFIKLINHPGNTTGTRRLWISGTKFPSCPVSLSTRYLRICAPVISFECEISELPTNVDDRREHDHCNHPDLLANHALAELQRMTVQIRRFRVLSETIDPHYRKCSFPLAHRARQGTLLANMGTSMIF
jgi:hypothetical protein